MRVLKRLSLIGFATVGCADQSPARIEIPATSMQLVDTAPKQLGAQLVNSSGQVLRAPSLSYSATPVNVLTATPDGKVACRSTGDGTVIVAGGGQSASVTVSCRLIVAIKGPSEARLILGRMPERASFEAIDDRGKTVSNASLTAASSNTSILKFENDQLIPVAVGKATLAISAGAVQKTVDISVIEIMASKPLALSDGETITWALQQGSYELDLEVRAIGSSRTRDGVTVSWIGTACPEAAESVQHTIRCTVDNTASLTVRNPTMLGLGPTLNGFINLYRGAP